MVIYRQNELGLCFEGGFQSLLGRVPSHPLLGQRCPREELLLSLPCYSERDFIDELNVSAVSHLT